MKRLAVSLLPALAAATTFAAAAPATYDIDPEHTYPSFEADHMGLSLWRGKFNHSSGTVRLDKETGTGTVDLVIDLKSVDTGHDKVNEFLAGPEFFDTARYPTATYQGRLEGFGKGTPRITGTLSLHGVTKPLDLKVNSFKCIPHPMLKRDYCGADAFVVFKREAFGLNAGKDYGFNMDVTMRIQVEAIAAHGVPKEG